MTVHNYTTNIHKHTQRKRWLFEIHYH